jgi:hypothetical protein
MVWMHSSHSRLSIRSASAMIASTDPELTAATSLPLLPPLPANAAAGTSMANATAAIFTLMFFMVIAP